jgi:hypothetical protein
VVCAWYTADYARWLLPLLGDLDELGHEYDFREVPKMPDWSWEEETRRKAWEAGKFLDKHEGKTVMLVDVDCQILRPLDDLIENFRGDVGFYISTRFRRSGGLKIRARSGTMVFAPTPQARTFVTLWDQQCALAPKYEVDQTALLVGIVRATFATFQGIPLKYCCIEGECSDAVILHDSASRHVKKVKNWRKKLMAVFRRR